MKILKQLQSDTQQRSFAIDRANLNEESRTVELAFSSEEPHKRWFGVEILGHNKEEVEMDFLSSGRAPLLAGHNADDQIGVIEKAWIDSDRVGRALVRFGRSARAEEIFNDVKDGIRGNISVGYRVKDMQLVSKSDEDETYRVTKWQPLEASVVSVPADSTVGIGRNDEINIEHIPEVKTMEDNKDFEEAKAAEVAKVRDEELARLRDITALGKMHGYEAEAEAAIKSGASTTNFRMEILDKIGKRQPQAIAVPDIGLDMSKKEVKQYSFLKLIRALATNDWSKAGFEKECSQAFEDKTGRQAKGAFIPHDVLIQRDLSTGIGTAGGYLVAENLQSGSFIDMLRNSTSVMKLGARVLTGLVGDADIPKQTGGATAYWINEGGTLTESAQTLGQIRMTPKTIGCYTDITRRMMLQSSIDVEGFIRQDFAQQMAIAIDLAGITGTGASGEPRGILNTSGIGSVTLNAANTPDWGDIVDLETAIASDNALMGSLAYLTNATIAGNMKQTEKASGTAQFILANGSSNGYPVEVSNNVPAKYILFGNFSDMIIGMWSGLDVTVDSTTLGTSGGTRVICFQDLDIVIRHAESFASGYKS